MSSGKILLTIAIFMLLTRKGTDVFATCLCYLLECQVNILVASGVLDSGLYQLLVIRNLNSEM
jgi:hypothetical protein